MITVFDCAIAHGAREDERGGITAAEFDRLGLPFFCGCLHCAASLAAYNAYPTRTGFTMCRECCTEEDGFETVEDFESWEAMRKGQMQ